jgi:Gene product 88
VTTAKALKDATGGLGYPSKMPGTSFGIPAQACKTGAKLHNVPDSVCADCYALKGNYIYPSVQKAQETRLALIDSPQWAKAMVTLLTVTHARGMGRKGPIDSGWHRWHDSGDIQSVSHLAKICEVARGTPQIQHWLPTRETAMVAAYVRDGGIVPDNLTIRISATMVDGPATKAWPITSRVHHNAAPAAGAHVCPAPTQGNACGACRACWNPEVACVTYHKH